MTDALVIDGLREIRASAPDRVLPGVMLETGLADGYVTRSTVLGDVYVAFSTVGVSACVPVTDPEGFERSYAARVGRPAVRVDDLPPELADDVDRALASGRADELMFDLRGISPFARDVLMKTIEIPPGQVRPYRWVAREIGRPRAVRAVGTALARNPVPVFIPCHRVVRSDGSVGNYAFGPESKTRLLQAEGVDPSSMAGLVARA